MPPANLNTAFKEYLFSQYKLMLKGEQSAITDTNTDGDIHHISEGEYGELQRIFVDKQALRARLSNMSLANSITASNKGTAGSLPASQLPTLKDKLATAKKEVAQLEGELAESNNDFSPLGLGNYASFKPTADAIAQAVKNSQAQHAADSTPSDNG